MGEDRPQKVIKNKKLPARCKPKPRIRVSSNPATAKVSKNPVHAKLNIGVQPD